MLPRKEISGNFHADVVDMSLRVHIRKDKTNPRRLTYLALLLFAEPGEPWLLAVGTLLALAGITFHAWASGYLARAGYVEREKVLTVRGPYRHCRNPYYLAHLVMDFGFFCLAGYPLFYLLYFPIIFYVYHYRWILKEEKFLEEEFGQDYRVFKSEVPRWGLRLRPAPARGREQRFSWRTLKRNRELSRALPHLVLIAIFWSFALYKDFFDAIDPLFLTTFIFGFGTFLLCRDVFPVNNAKLSFGWCLFSVFCTVAGVIFLGWDPLWKEHSPQLVAFFSTAGVILAIFVALTSIPQVLRYLGKSPDEIYPRAMTQWYLAFLALGLVCHTLGPIWMGFVFCSIWLTLAISGVVSLPRFPERPQFALFLAFACSAAAIL